MSNNGYYTEDPSKAVGVSVPVAQGYVVYQACLAPPPGDGSAPSSVTLETDMKNLSLRPLLPAPAPAGYSTPTDGFSGHQGAEGSTVYAIPVRNSGGFNSAKGATLLTSCGSSSPSPVANTYVASIQMVNRL